MSAKVRWEKGAYWLVTHHQNRRRKQRFGPLKSDKRCAEAAAEKANASLALGQFRWPAKPKRLSWMAMSSSSLRRRARTSDLMADLA